MGIYEVPFDTSTRTRHVGYWCPRNDHLSRKPCGTTSIPIYVDKRDEQEMTDLIFDAGPGCG